MKDITMDASGLDPMNVTYWFPFEKTFVRENFDNYMKQHWSDCFVYSAVYVMIIFSLKFYMTNRKAYNLRPYLAIWSTSLAVFSILGTIRCLPEFIWSLRNHGFEHLYCNNSYLEQGKVSTVWNVLFLLSKVVELGDTVFIVLRKQKLIFLHWYHHITVMMYCWYSYNDHIANCRVFVITNFAVHSPMYSYFAFRAMKFQFPKWVNMCITFLQLAQMIWGLLIVILTCMAYSAGRPCVTHYQNITFALLMYFSYFMLFANFFYKTYIVKSPSVHEKKH